MACSPLPPPVRQRLDRVTYTLTAEQLEAAVRHYLEAHDIILGAETTIADRPGGGVVVVTHFLMAG